MYKLQLQRCYSEIFDEKYYQFTFTNLSTGDTLTEQFDDIGQSEESAIKFAKRCVFNHRGITLE